MNDVWKIEASGKYAVVYRHFLEGKNRNADDHTRLVRDGVDDRDVAFAVNAAQRRAIETVENLLLDTKREYGDRALTMTFDVACTGSTKLASLSFVVSA